MKVCGTTTAAVCHAVGNELGYTGQKLRMADKVTETILLHWPAMQGASERLNKRKMRKIMKRRVKANLDTYAVQPYGILETVLWTFIVPMIINAVVKLVVDWLMSKESQTYRMAQVHEQ